MQEEEGIIQLIRPQIPIDLLHERSQKHQNWGTYTCLFFRKAKPIILLTYSKWLGVILAAQYVAIIKSTMDWQLSLCLIVTLLNMALLIKIQLTDPGIQSSALPVANEQSVLGMPSYCQLCRCLTSDTVKHCSTCNVCIENGVHHSMVLNRCVTIKTFKLWFWWLSLTIVSIVSLLTTKVIRYLN